MSPTPRSRVYEPETNGPPRPRPDAEGPDYVNPPTSSFDDWVRGQIRRWLEVRGMTQTTLSERIGRNQVWLSRYLKGEFATDFDTLALIAEAFDQTLFALLAVPRDDEEAQLMGDYRALPRSARRLARQLVAELARPRRAPARSAK
jgi:transcriptional regulator with XRE-family HTH domain